MASLLLLDAGQKRLLAPRALHPARGNAVVARPLPVPPHAASAAAPGSFSASQPFHPTNLKNSQTSRMLDVAQQELEELCTTTEDADCWKAHAYFVERRAKLEGHCDLEHDTPETVKEKEACNSLQALAQLTRESMAGGSINNLRNALLMSQRAEERRRAGTTVHVSSMKTEDAAKAASRSHLIGLFNELDRNGDGLLSIVELQLGMEKRGAALDTVDLCEISSIMSDNQHMTLEDFIAVMEAGNTMMDGLVDDSVFLRHSQHSHRAPMAQHAQHYMRALGEMAPPNSAGPSSS